MCYVTTSSFGDPNGPNMSQPSRCRPCPSAPGSLHSDARGCGAIWTEYRGSSEPWMFRNCHVLPKGFLLEKSSKIINGLPEIRTCSPRIDTADTVQLGLGFVAVFGWRVRHYRVFQWRLFRKRVECGHCHHRQRRMRRTTDGCSSWISRVLNVRLCV